MKLDAILLERKPGPSIMMTACLTIADLFSLHSETKNPPYLVQYVSEGNFIVSICGFFKVFLSFFRLLRVFRATCRTNDIQ
jgi:hypothetical protein